MLTIQDAVSRIGNGCGYSDPLLDAFRQLAAVLVTAGTADVANCLIDGIEDYKTELSAMQAVLRAV